jgi:signal transduction histidine kinase/ActR/RegA family two-component response regulator
MSTRRRRGVRPIVIVVLVLLAGLSVGGFAVTRSAIRGAESRLLDERAGEVGVLLTSSISGLRTTLDLAGESYSALGSPGPGFTAIADSLVKGAVTGVGVATIDEQGATVGAAVGTAPPIGEALSGDWLRLARRAAARQDLVTAIVSDPSSGRSRFLLAFGRADGLVVYEESVASPRTPLPSTADSPYRELEVALYRSPRVDDDQLILTTSKSLPLTGRTDRRTLEVGAERWSMVTAAGEPLSSSLALSVPWIILGGGLFATVVAAAVVLMLVRRREYAVALVDERTADLRSAMKDLEVARQAADAANQAKSVFLSRMSHELRTPLNAVIGFAQVLQMGRLDPEQQDEVHQILKGGNHLLALINEVLDISRIESGDLALSPEAVLVGEVVAETLELMRPLAAQRSIQIDGDEHATCTRFVFADRQRIKQILLNLVSNAVKYNRGGGTVRVSCEPAGPTRLRINVADDGPGIHSDDLSRIFVPFERLGAAQTEIEGTGIGLALSQRLAEAMGGSLSVESALGEGSTFHIELPVVEGPVERFLRLGGPGEPELEPSAAPGRRVMYIEDNLANLKLMERVLARRSDLEIVPAMQGRLGLDLARLHPPDLILLDLHLPDIPGDEVLQRLREDPQTASVPVIVVSADATPGRVQRLLTAGASGYLTKPFDVADLLSLVDRHVPRPAPAPSTATSTVVPG